MLACSLACSQLFADENNRKTEKPEIDGNKYDRNRLVVMFT
jgi:hypothetical protein